MNATAATQPPGFTARASPRPPIPDVARIARTSAEASQPIAPAPSARPAAAVGHWSPVSGRSDGSRRPADAREQDQRDAGGLVVVEGLEQAGEDRGPRGLGDERQADGHERERAARAPGSLVVRHRDTTRRSAVRQWRSIVARLASNPSDRARAASRCASGPAVIDDDVGTRRARAGGAPTANGRGSRAVSTSTVVPGRTVRATIASSRSNGAEAWAESRASRSRTRWTWPGADETGDARDPRLRARVARGHQPERDPPVAERPGQRSGDDVQRLDVVAPESGLPGGPVDGLDVEGDQHLALAGRLEPLGHRLADAGARPGVDPADRVARGVGPDAGEPRRVLGEAELRAGRGRPTGRAARSRWSGSSAARRGTCRSRDGDRGGQQGERVADREVHGPDPEHATPVGARRGTGGPRAPTAAASTRCAGPRSPGSAPSTSSRSRTLTPGVASSSARSQGSGSRWRFQTSTPSAISSPNAARRAARRRRVADVADAGARPRRVDDLDQQRRRARARSRSGRRARSRSRSGRARGGRGRPSVGPSSAGSRQPASTGGAGDGRARIAASTRVGGRAVEACGRGRR